MINKIRITDFKSMKDRGEKITMITAYDAIIANILDEAGVDSLLVGDSLGNVVQGLDTTLPVTLDEIIYHTRLVSRGARRTHLSSDMPFMSYQVSIEEAVRNAGRLVKEGGAESVKLEINENYIDTIHAIFKSGIPVISHLGLCPQSVHVMGGYKVQGISEEDHKKLLELSVLSEQAGASAVLLESVPSGLAREITELIKIPTIGIGAGNDCDGQVLVINDLLGISAEPLPKFVKKYANLRKVIADSTVSYIYDVKNSIFPSKENSYDK
ncbi:MAG: 3-methyl-2-oxobutanoate hydroxymethyltransferase [Thermodesulfobacteriota bacterium]